MPITMNLAHEILNRDLWRGSEYAINADTSMIGQFMKFSDITNYERALPGVSQDTMMQMLVHPRRTIVDGKHMVAILFNDGGWNICAWCINEPEEPYIWNAEQEYMLGRENIAQGFRTGRLPVVYSTPLEWMQTAMQGVVYLG